ncbi:MAG: Phosphoadenosine phosphosulfate reductase [Acidobacteriaceae bacterium]|nr:Phosphoadenosine phosphosulfate reductase [Acidobacteriaceae bacterium]
MRVDLERAKVLAESWNPEAVLAWAFSTYGDTVALATGMGVEGMALLDIAHRVNPRVKVFTGDTELLFPETYDLIDRVEARYGIKIERLYSELTPRDQERAYGKALWASDPDQCCNLRKVEPLRRKLSTLDAWVTAIRRDQTPTRASIRKVDWDSKFDLVKISPLADWTREAVWRYVLDHDVPYNPLHDRNYPSIGCTHCTRAVLPGEDQRAGRWSGSAKVECGLHAPNSQPATELVQLTAAAGDD